MPDADLIDAPPEAKEAFAQFVEVTREHVNLFETSKGEGLRTNILKTILTKAQTPEASTGQKAAPGLKCHPFDYDSTAQLQLLNAHHSTCIKTKVAACVGLGFTDGLKVEMGDPMKGKPDRRIQKRSKVEEALDVLCDQFFMDVLSDVCEDFFQVGNGHMEVKRPQGKILGLYHIPAATTHICVEPDGYNYHYVINPNDSSISERKFARFGERDRLIQALNLTGDAADDVSEVIHFRQPTSLSQWYGFPDWLSAVPCIELVQCMVQYQYDFFLNRGVPEFMLFIMGQKLSKDDWKVITDALKANIGMGNSHKSLALNLSNPEIVVQLEKLGIDAQPEGGFETTETSKAMTIVTAHRVPPLLAGIQIPGKLGAANEMINAMMSFHTLVIAPAQAIFQKTLGFTLGAKGSGLNLGHDDFTFRTLLDDLDPARMDTIGRMRQELPTANAQGRDINAGLKK